MARNSPRPTLRSTPRSASTSTRPTRYTLRRPRISMIAGSLICQRLDGILPGSAKARVERAQQRGKQRDQAGSGPPPIRNGLLEGSGNERQDQPAGDKAEDDAGHRAAQAHYKSFGDNQREHIGAGSAQRFQNA